MSGKLSIAGDQTRLFEKFSQVWYAKNPLHRIEHLTILTSNRKSPLIPRKKSMMIKSNNQHKFSMLNNNRVWCWMKSPTTLMKSRRYPLIPRKRSRMTKANNWYKLSMSNNNRPSRRASTTSRTRFDQATYMLNKWSLQSMNVPRQPPLIIAQLCGRSTVNQANKALSPQASTHH